MGQDNVEVPAADDGHHDVDASCCQANCAGEPFGLHLHEFIKGAALTGNFGKIRRILGVMEMENVEPVDPKCL